MAPVVMQPEIVDQLHLAVDKSVYRHEDSTHADHRYAMMFVGLETGSIRLLRQFMKGKSYPYRPEQWPDVVLKGMDIMNRANRFPNVYIHHRLTRRNERRRARVPGRYAPAIEGGREDRTLDGPAMGVLFYLLAV
jgi:hypothetical protein